MKSAWTHYWQNLQPRERAIIAGGGGLLCLALLYAYLWLPLHQQRQKLQASLPQLRVQAMQLQTARDEVLRLKAQVGSVTRQPLQQLLTASATAQGLTLQKVELAGEQNALLVLENVAFDDWLRWLNVLQTQHGLHLLNAEITRTGLAGRVSVQATVSQE